MRVIAREDGVCGEIALRKGAGVGGQAIYEIILNGVFLMSSRNRASERALARLAIEPLRTEPPVPHPGERLHALVAGLGMGFTLQALLTHATVGFVDLVEIEPAVVAWNRTLLSHLNDHALEDPRVRLIEADICQFISSTPRRYHAVCLDVDNGPTWTVSEANLRLYDTPMLERLRELLRPGGVLTTWAAEKSDQFEQRLATVYRSTESIGIEDVDARGDLTTYWVYRVQR